MKRLLVAASLVALAASPALARDQIGGTEKVVA